MTPNSIHSTKIEKKAENLIGKYLQHDKHRINLILKSYSSSPIQKITRTIRANCPQVDYSILNSSLKLSPAKKTINSVTKWISNSLKVEMRNKKLKINKSSGEKTRTYI